MSNNVVIASHAGFCFGVKRATDAVEQRIADRKSGESIYTLGHLIHNEGYNARLEALGVRAIKESELADIFAGCDESHHVTVFIRAHGVTVDVESTLKEYHEKNQFFEYVDLTCPYVKKIHRIADQNSGDDSIFAVLGAKDHPEVVGIMSYAHGEKTVFESADALEEYIKKA